MLTTRRLKELLHYDPDTGVFTWRVKSGRSAAGSQAGSNKGTRGYRRIMLDKTLYLGHRLAIQYMTGKVPQHDVDHINGVTDDNRYCNLRNATRSINNQNRRTAMRKNATGYLGVTQDKRDGRYYAAIFVDGVKRGLGGYATPEEAYEAYVKAKRQFHKGCTI